MAVPYAVLILEQKINTFPCHISQIILGDKLWEISKCLLLINAIRSATGAIPSALGKGVLGGPPEHWEGGPVQSCFLCLSAGTRLQCRTRSPTTPAQVALWGKVGRIKTFTSSSCNSVPLVCEARAFMSPDDAVAALSLHLYNHHHLLNGTFLFRIWAEELLRCVWLHREASKEPYLFFRMSKVRTGQDF